MFVCRMQLTVLHFNENTSRNQKTSISGEPLYTTNDKNKKGATVNKVLEEATYGENTAVYCL